MSAPESLPAAPLWRRLAAMFYDAFLVIALWIILGFVVLRAFGIDSVQVENEQVVLDPLYRVVQFSTMVLSAFAFFTVFWMKSGQTLGMQAWRIKVQNADGSPLHLSQCLIRFLAALPSLGLFGLGYFWMLVDPQRKTVPDRLSKSAVVRVPL